MRKKNSIFAKIFAYVCLPLMFFIAGFYLWYTWEGTEARSTEDNLEYIIDHFNSQGKLVDTYREICVYSVNDVKWFLEDNVVKIEYGIIPLSWKLEEFVDPVLDDTLKRIGITRYKDPETGRLRIFFYEEEVERWVH